MLRIYFGDMPKAIYNTEVYFKNTYRPQWLESSVAKEMIHDIDGSEVLSGNVIDSPYLGLIPPTSLSGGVKTLLLILNEPNKIFNASTCGDNCAPWILRLAEERDITINLRHLMDFGKDFTAYIVNKKKTVHGMLEYVIAAGEYV